MSNGAMRDGEWYDVTMTEDHPEKVGLDMLGDLIINTPVDLGPLRAAWQGQMVGNQFHITNDKPYCEANMEHGHSKQAAVGTLSAIIAKYCR